MNNSLKEFRPESVCLLKENQEDYWRYARKGPHDFSVYTERSSIYEAPTKEKFKESTDVLVRWTDGLLYLATIIQVEDEYSRCAVKFEDGSQFWALYKDIYKGPLPENEFACTVCDSSSSQPPDEIVICDKCSVGYHQLCHIPKIATTDLNPDIPWSCRKCVFVATAKKGGATKKGSNAQAMLLMKETLPYNLEGLSWDASHRSNLQQTYCYCGGPGEWYSKMLQCLRCKQWFHEACLQCLDDPLLYGDRFYIFVCTMCNKGPEFLRRLPLRWPDIAHLVLFNLSVMHGKKFFEFDTTIMTFLKDNWSQFQVKGESLSRMLGDEKKKKLLEHLKNTKSRFTSGKEMKRKTCVWGLRSRVPPPVPAITLPKCGVITNDVLDSFNALSRKSKPIIKPISTSIPVKRPRKPSTRESVEVARHEISSKTVTKIEKPIQLPSEEEKPKRALQQQKKERRKLPHRLAKRPKPNGLKTRKAPRVIDLTESDDTTSSHDTLNSIIPYPINFEGLNNPFLSNSPASYSESTSTVSETDRSQRKSSKQNYSESDRSQRKHSVKQSYSESTPAESESDRPQRKCTKQSYSESNPTESETERPQRKCTKQSYNESVIERPQRKCTKQSYSESDPTESETDSRKLRSKNSTKQSCSESSTPIESESEKPPSTHSIKLRIRPSRKYTKPAESVINHLLNDSTDFKMASDKSSSTCVQNALDLSSSVSTYFGMEDRIENGEKFAVLAKRTGPNGKVQYLVEWDCLNSS